jgi:hypothetical protein
MILFINLSSSLSRRWNLMELDKDRYDVEERKILSLLRLDDAIQRTIKVAEKDFERGGSGYAKKFFSIPRRARYELAGRSEWGVRQMLDAAIQSKPHVCRGFASIWSHPGLIFRGQYSITLFINT